MSVAIPARAASPVTAAAVADVRPARWEWGAAIASMFMMSGALIGPIFAPDMGENAILRLAWLPIYAFILMLAMRRAREIGRLWPAVLICAALVGLTWASVLWSVAPETTMRRVVAVGITMLLGLYVAAMFRGPRLLRLLCWTFLSMGLLSLVFVAAIPSLGIHDDVNAGMWRGIWYEKNQAGMMMFNGAIAALALLVSGGEGRRLAVATLIVCVLFMLGTQSKTSLLCLLSGGGLVVGFHVLRKVGPAAAVVLLWLGALALAGIFTAIAASPETFYALLGKDPTLTGRTAIWDAMWLYIEERPALGWGYAAFWKPDTIQADWIRFQNEWPVPHAHHSWMDLLLQLGWTGVAFMVVAMAVAVVGVLARLPTQGVREGYWAAGFLVTIGLLGLSESMLLLYHNLIWVLFVVALASRFAPPAPPPAPTPSRRPRRALRARPSLRPAYADATRRSFK